MAAFTRARLARGVVASPCQHSGSRHSRPGGMRPHFVQKTDSALPSTILDSGASNLMVRGSVQNLSHI